jgi:N-acetylmuramoyl-L-alanine amidase
MECICAVLWINPFFHLIKKEIKAIHEFLADRHAISSNNQYDYAELLILQSLKGKKNPMANYFFQNHIKRRIAMITQFKNNKYSYWTRLMVLPLSILLFCAIAIHAQAPNQNIMGNQLSQPSVKALNSITVLIDAGHGGEDAGARNDKGLVEKDLALDIAKQIQQHAGSYNINVVMTRDEDKYPGIKERADMAKTVNADMIISLHVAGNNIENVGGFDFYITNKNQQTVAKSRILSQEIARQISSIYTVGGIKQRKEQGIWILDAVSCPSVIIECGYITNEKDMEFVTQPDNQQKIAKSILKGIVEYQSTPINQSVINDTIPVENQKNDSMNKIVDRQAREQQIQLQKLQELESPNGKMKEEIRNKKQHLNQKQHQLQAKQRTLNKDQLQKISKQKQLLVQKEQDRKLLEHKIHYEKHLEIQKQQQNKLLHQKIQRNKNLHIENQKNITVLQEKINKENLIGLEKQKQIQNKFFEQRIRDEKQRLQKQQQMKSKQQALAEVQINKNKKTKMSNIQRKQPIEYDRQKMLNQKLKQIENQKQQLEKQQKKIEQEINEANQLKNKPSNDNWD